MRDAIRETTITCGSHRNFVLSSGPEDGPPLIFVHGWPELSHSWRHQLRTLGALGFHCIAPDMRGYGGSTLYSAHDDYAQQAIVEDMCALHSALELPPAVWIGHDWGSPVVWNLASHHPGRCRAVASLCVPYGSLDHGLDGLITLVDRSVYPEEEYAAGQWDYMRFYEEDFERACSVFEADCRNTVKALFRRGDPRHLGRPAGTAAIRRHGGWFAGADAAPDVPIDEAVLTEADLEIYATALARNGFFGPDSWYMNHDANARYAATARDGGVLSMPCLFLSARYDQVCESERSALGTPMRRLCRDLTWQTIDSGHWMAQEQPVAVNAALVHWLATRVPDVWPS